MVPGSAERPQIDLRQIRDFEARIFDAAPLPESAPHRGFVFRLNLLPKKAGALHVPSLNIAGTARRRTTEPFTLDVSEPEPAPDMSLTATLSASACYVGEPLTLELTWTLGSEVSTIQAVDLRVPLIEHMDFKSRDFSSRPKDFGTPIGLPVSNGRVIGGVAGRTIRFRKIIVPQKAGTFSIPGGTVLCSIVTDSTPRRPGLGAGFQYAPQYDNQFFSDAESASAQRLYTRSPPIRIQVRPLPEAGKPADFSGIVGAFSLSAAIEPSTLREGEPVTLTLRVRDYAFAEVLELPPFARLPGFRGRFRIPADRGVPTLENTDEGPEKIFRQSFRPVSTGVDKVPAITIPFFDPKTTTYRFATAPEMPLRVFPHSIATGFDAILSDGSRLKNILVSSGPAIGPNFSQGELHRPPLATWADTAGFWWVALAVPPLAWAALIRATRRWRCRRLSPERERVLWAYPDVLDATRRVTDPETLTSALHAYLSRRLGIAVVTFGAVEGKLREQGVAESDVRRLREVLAWGDRRDFSAHRPADGRVVLTRESLREVVGSIEAAFLRRRGGQSGFPVVWSLVIVVFFCLITIPLHAGVPLGTLAEAETLFQTGVAQKFDHPEAAQDAFRKASAGFEYLLTIAEPSLERGKLHYNCGAARFSRRTSGVPSIIFAWPSDTCRRTSGFVRRWLMFGRDRRIQRQPHQVGVFGIRCCRRGKP
ncbi:MAG: BatD family protein [Verrucomicrobia bacterium]|nr:BatD family protein [Verrucomicrobiota bacterium]